MQQKRQQNLQKLQDGFADVCIHALVLEQLILQANWLPQAGSRLTQHVV